MTERLKIKTGRSTRITHTRWNWGRGYLRRGKRIGDKRFESVRGECTIVNWNVIYVKVDT